jgi:hypothetical protein
MRRGQAPATGWERPIQLSGALLVFIENLWELLHLTTLFHVCSLRYRQGLARLCNSGQLAIAETLQLAQLSSLAVLPLGASASTS